MTATFSAFDFHFATPAGESAVTVVELYGPGAGPALERILHPRSGSLPAPGCARLCEVRDGHELLDEAIVQRLPGEGLWSGMPGWVLTLHGGAWLADRLDLLLARNGGVHRGTVEVLRLAVAAGALDAVQAAAFELLLEASTEEAAAFLSRQHAGEMSQEIRRGLDLVERGDLNGAREVAQALLGEAPRASRLCHPLRVLIAGRPNAGKSTLFNCWLGRELAAATPLPGTTRDLLEAETQIDGYPVRLVDGAGARPPGDVGEAEREGIRRARSLPVDVVICLVPFPWTLTAVEEEILARQGRGRCLLVASQCDLGDAGGVGWADLAISPLRGDGVAELRASIRRRWIDATSRTAGDVAAAAFTAAQVELLQRGAAARGLDELRDAFIECLRHSWPVTPQHA